MFIKTYFFLLLNLLSFQNVNSVVDTYDNVDYILVNQGNTEYNIKKKNKFYKFSTGLDDEYIINTTNTLDECKAECANMTKCLGVFYYVNESDTNCNLLSKLGNVANTKLESYSYRKHLHYINNNTHDLIGYIADTNSISNKSLETYVYIDLNHNGKYDNNEPINITKNELFTFSNLRPGKYLVREIVPEGCYQILPANYMLKYKSYYDNDDGNGYIDNVVEYYNSGHHTKSGIHGGNINGTKTENANLNVLFSNSSNYITFYPQNFIIVSFIDETIHDNIGNDIFIDVYGNTTIFANISVSTDNVNYYYVGELNNNTTSFDLNIINFTDPVSYIKLHFHKHSLRISNKDKINIIGIHGSKKSISVPSFGYNVIVPREYNIIFINDCHFYFSCSTYCYYSILSFDESKSCSIGCNLVDLTNGYTCDNYDEQNTISNNNEYIYFTGENFSYNQCINGYYYSINTLLFPDYQIYKNSKSLKQNIISSMPNNYKSTKKYVLDLKKNCDNITECNAFNLNLEEKNNYLYNNYNRIYDNYSILIIKKEDLHDTELNYHSITSTSNTVTTNTVTSTSNTVTTNTNTTTSNTVTTNTVTTNTVTSNTVTSTSNTVTTNTNTTTSSSNTSTSSSNTVTSSSNTSTSNTSTSNTVTSNTVTSNTSTNTNSRNIKTKTEDTLKFKIILSLSCFIFILSIIVIVGVWFIKRKDEPPENKEITSFENPAYNSSIDNSIISTDLYSNTTFGCNNDDDYLEIAE